mgnify:CR=1 FL=1
MLEYLRIRNLALIEDVELEFSPGLNVLTGETGAGKTFVLKALGFLLGDRLLAEMVRSGAERAQVEALFHLEGEELVVRRELSADSGRSRLYINDTLRSQDSLREMRDRLVSYTSQHAHQKLLQASFQARLLEGALASPELLHERDALLTRLDELAQERAALEERRNHLLERRDLLEMQQQEIDRVAPQEGEEEHLENLRAQVRACEQNEKNQAAALALLYGEDSGGLLDLLSRFEKVLHRMCDADTIFQEDAETVAAFRQQLSDMGARLRRPRQNAPSAANINALEERLFALAQLKRKLQKTLPEILALREEIANSLSFLDACALDILHLDKQTEQKKKELADVLMRIIPDRRESAHTIARKLEQELRQLGFSDQARVIPDFVPHEIWPGIADERGQILWAPNPGQPPLPLHKIVSGGELSRFLLALASIRPDTAGATFVFDEVDAGVGGLTLNKLSEKLCGLACKHQVLLITHWPQLAAQAHRHFQISKVVRAGETFTLCAPLDPKRRHRELARMAGGGTQGEALARSLDPLYTEKTDSKA